MKTLTSKELEELRQCIEDPTLLSDNGSLRMHLAHIIGVTVKPYPRGHEPWNVRLVPKKKT